MVLFIETLKPTPKLCLFLKKVQRKKNSTDLYHQIIQEPDVL